MKKIFIWLFAAALAIPACKDKDKKTTVSGDKKEVTSGDDKTDNKAPSRTGGFTIEAPRGWEKRDTTYMGENVTLIKSPMEDASDDFLENVNVITEKVGSMGLDEYLDKNVTNMESGLTGFEKGKISTRNINGVEFRIMHYKHSYGGTPIDAEVYFAIEDGTAYVITCSAKGGYMDQWESTFDGIVNTFKLT